MDESGVRAAVQHYLDHSAARDEDAAHQIYLDDAVLEFPQSGERFDGVGNFREWRRQYPATKVEFDVRRVRGARGTSGSSRCACATTAGHGTTASRSWNSGPACSPGRRST